MGKKKKDTDDKKKKKSKKHQAKDKKSKKNKTNEQSDVILNDVINNEDLADYVSALSKKQKSAQIVEQIIQIEKTGQSQTQPQSQSEQLHSEPQSEPQPELKPELKPEPKLSFLSTLEDGSIKGYDFLFKTQQNCYLVDYENVKIGGLYGLDLLSENNVVCIFFSNNHNKFTIDEIETLKKTKAKIVTFKVDVQGRNALDFQLVSYLGYLIAEHLRHGYIVNYHIITEDRGFDNVVRLWRKFNIHIDRRLNISNVAGVPKVYKSELEKAVYENGFSPEMSKDVMAMVSLCKTKVDLHNRIIQVYGYKYTAEKCSAFYRVIKNLLPYK